MIRPLGRLSFKIQSNTDTMQFVNGTTGVVYDDTNRTCRGVARGSASGEGMVSRPVHAKNEH